MTHLAPINVAFQYGHIVATGGIGSGIFFLLEGNQTLGRNESRMASLLPYKDYCKQHIILHYVAVLLGGGNHFKVFPIGKVGADKTGDEMIAMMNSAGMDTQHVFRSPAKPTMFSVCYQYADHSGGNITTSGSACEEVRAADIESFFNTFQQPESRGVALAVPEVPLEARISLLTEGRNKGYLNVACVQSAEVSDFIDRGGIPLTDVLSVNIDEAKALLQVDEHLHEPASLAKLCHNKLKELNPQILLLMTAGKQGVYLCQGEGDPEFTPALEMPVVSTAGAGDAFLAGFICGLCCGLPSRRSYSLQTLDRKLSTAVDLGLLVASLSVTSPDTINTSISAENIVQLITERKLMMEDSFAALFTSKLQS